jgi:hypothetical protein
LKGDAAFAQRAKNFFDLRILPAWAGTEFTYEFEILKRTHRTFKRIQADFASLH